jgi:hypothetical protein
MKEQTEQTEEVNNVDTEINTEGGVSKVEQSKSNTDVQTKAVTNVTTEEKIEVKEEATKSLDLESFQKRLEALEVENKALRRDKILSNVDANALKAIQDKGIDLNTMDNKVLSVLAQSINAVIGAKPINNVKINNTVKNDVEDTKAFMKAWNKAQGRA